MNCLCQDGWLSLGPRTTCGKEIKNLEQRDRMAVPPALWSGIFSSPCLVWSCLYTSLPFVVVQFLVMCFFHTIYFLSCSFPSPNSSQILPTFLPSNFMFSLSLPQRKKKERKASFCNTWKTIQRPTASHHAEWGRPWTLSPKWMYPPPRHSRAQRSLLKKRYQHCKSHMEWRTRKQAL